LVFLSVFLISTNCFADAGRLQQQMDKQRGTELPKQAKQLVPLLEAIQSVPHDKIITVKSFGFTGNNLIDGKQLGLVLSDYVGHPVSFSELQQVVSKITAYYRESGWIVKAYLPRQDITAGDVTIHIIEAVFGGAQIKDGEAARIQKKTLLSIIDRTQAIGSPLNVQHLDRALLLMDDLPGVTLTGSLKKGKGENETVLVLQTVGEPLVISNLSLDNFGSRSTGHEQLIGSFYFNSPLGLGDQGTVNFTHSQGNDYARLAYSIPVGHDGWRVGASGSYLEYELVNDDFEGLGAKGSSSTIGLDSKYPIIRSRLNNLFLGINVDHKQFDNEANNTTVSSYEVNSLSLGLSGNAYDNIAGGGANSIGLNITRGIVDLGEVDLSENSALDGDFTKLTYYVSRQQVITDTISLYGLLSGQESDGNLDSSEKMYLGGAYGVRAYPSNEAGGDEGQLINIELRSRLPNNFNLTGFYDWGHINVNHNNVNNASPNSITLEGVGLSLGWQATSGLNLNAVWSRRLGDNPNPTLDGEDQDGSFHSNRFWLQASMQF